MRPPRRLTARIAAVALVAAGSLIALQPGATAAPTHATPHAATSVSTQSTAAVAGSVTIRLSIGGSVTIPGTQLSVGTTLDTGVQVSAVDTVINNTNATLEFSGSGSASVTVAPGTSADLGALVGGTLKIAVA